MSILAAMQHTIEFLHDVQVDLDVTAYVVDDAGRRDLPGAREGLPEQLFVREADEALEIALYIAPSIVAQLEQDNPHERLHAGNLENYCIALEGVSHFVFLAWRATVGWPVSALEMEIQAEVDKFLASWLLLAEQGQTLGSSAAGLQKQLFHSYSLREEISGDEADRYHMANRVAQNFCSTLAQRFADDTSNKRIMHAARVFHRRTLAQKLRAA